MASDRTTPVLGAAAACWLDRRILTMAAVHQFLLVYEPAQSALVVADLGTDAAAAVEHYTITEAEPG